jgi:uncharacterized protein
LKLRPKIIKPQEILSKPWLTVSVYIVSFGVAELMLYHVSMPWSVALYFGLLGTLVVKSTFTPNEDQRRFWLGVGLVPLIRVVSILIQSEELAQVTSYVLIGVTVLLCIYIMVRHLKYNFDEIGLNSRYFWSQILTAISGLGLGIIDYLILKPQPLVAGSFLQLIFPMLVLLIFTGFVEELAFRGVMQRVAGALGARGWLSIAIVYAVLQIGSGSLPHIVFTFGVALFFGFVVQKTKSVIGVSVAHGVLNVFLFLLLPNMIL